MKPAAHEYQCLERRRLEADNLHQAEILHTNQTRCRPDLETHVTQYLERRRLETDRLHQAARCTPHNPQNGKPRSHHLSVLQSLERRQLVTDRLHQAARARRRPTKTRWNMLCKLIRYLKKGRNIIETPQTSQSRQDTPAALTVHPHINQVSGWLERRRLVARPPASTNHGHAAEP